MREILFRGKRIDSGEWVYGTMYKIATDLNPFILTIGKSGCSYQVEEETVGQYTGLKDKNGKRIFEGDIIKWDYPCNEGKSYQVIYDVGSACFVASREHNGNIIDTVFYNDGQHAEVISNVHDNPELLEK